MLDLLNQLKKGAIERREAQVVCGTLNFATNFVLGHSLKLAIQAFTAFTVVAARPQLVTPSEVARLCDWTAGLLTRLRPKQFPLCSEIAPAVIYTDAAFEDGVATWGVVLDDPVTDTRLAFGGQIHNSLVTAENLTPNASQSASKGSDFAAS